MNTITLLHQFLLFHSVFLSALDRLCIATDIVLISL